MNVRPRFLWLASCALVGVSAVAAAEQQGESLVDLSWTAPAGCPSAEDVEAEIRRLVAGAVSNRRWRAQAAVERVSEGAWILRLATEVDGRKSYREIQGASCSELAATTAIVLALAVAPTQITSPSQATDAATPPDASSPETVTTPAEAPTTAPPPPPRRTESATRQPTRQETPQDRSPLLGPESLALSVRGGGGVGAFASPAFGWGVGAAWLPSRFRFELAGLDFPVSHVNGVAPGIAADFALLLVGLTGCWSALQGSVQLGPCVGGEGGRVQATGNGSAVSIPFRKESAWAAAVAGGLLEWRATSHLGFRADMDLVVPFVRDHFVVSGVGEVHTPAVVSARALAGVEARFP